MKITDTLKLMTLPLVLLFALVSCDTRDEGPQQLIHRAELDQPAPPFSLMDSKGNSWSLADMKGKVIFLNFWATWCPPCRQEMPAMETLNKSMTGRPFQMITILTNDDPTRARNFVDQLGGTFPVLIDPSSETAAHYGITGVPETFIIDRNGILREKYIGPRPWESDSARQMIENYLK